MRSKSVLQNKKENPIVRKLHQQLSQEISAQSYLNLLAELILTLPPETLQSLSETQSENLVKATLLRQLYNAWKDTFPETILGTLSPIHSLVEILAWGFDLKLNKHKSLSLHSEILNNLTNKQSTALWIAIKLSGVKSIKIDAVGNLSPEAWGISRKGIIESDLRAIYFSGYGELLKFDDFWHTLFDVLKKSKIRSLGLQDMQLNRLNPELWFSLFETLSLIEIKSLDLTRSMLSSHVDLLGSIICIPSLRHLSWLSDSLELLPPNKWQYLSMVLGVSLLKRVEISLSSQRALHQNGWLTFLKSLKTLQLKTLSITHSNADELTPKVIKTLATMISENSLASFSCTHTYGKLSLSIKVWALLAKVFKEKNIQVGHWGSIDLSNPENFAGFFSFVLTSGMKSLDLSHFYLSNYSSLEWNNISKLIQTAPISHLDLRDNYLCGMNADKWKICCELFKADSMNHLSIDIYPMYQNNVADLCVAIQSSKLKIMDLYIHDSFWEMKFELIKGIFDAISKSGLSELNINNHPSSSRKGELISNTLRIIENKAKYTFWELGSLTLFGRKQLTDEGIRFQHQETVGLHRR
jgi:hypothetical protein